MSGYVDLDAYGKPRFPTDREPWDEIRCAACGHRFNAETWETRHTGFDALTDLCRGCCMTVGPCSPADARGHEEDL